MAIVYDVERDMWPGRERGEPLAPVRVGMNRRTGRILIGWPHVVQSLQILFSTRYHERILRQWAASFVPHLLGENGVEEVITRFWWALATAVDLWEPCYSVQRVHVLTPEGEELSDGDSFINSVEELRKGHIAFQMIGIYMPRGHLGDRTPEATRGLSLFGRGSGIWETAPAARDGGV